MSNAQPVLRRFDAAHRPSPIALRWSASPATERPESPPADFRHADSRTADFRLDGPERSSPHGSNSSLRVALAGKLTALDAPGGGESQLLATGAALCRGGIQARLWRPWEDGFDDLDVLHLFGSEREHLATAAAARRHGVQVALSTIAWFDLASRWYESGSRRRRLWSCGAYLLRSAAPRWPSWRRELYDAVDLLLPNSQCEAEQLMKLFGVESARIRIVPNGADARFATASPQPFREAAGLSDFVLYVGRIEPRKNQLGFLQAMRGTGLPVVVLGDVVPGHEDYLAACRRVAEPGTVFLPRLPHAHPLLASAYAACRCLALTSWFETPGLAALEAGMSGCPLVLTDRGCTREYFGALADYVSPSDPAAIRRAIETAWNRGRSAVLARFIQDSFSWDAAAAATATAYASITDGCDSLRRTA